MMFIGFAELVVIGSLLIPVIAVLISVRFLINYKKK